MNDNAVNHRLKKAYERLTEVKGHEKQYEAHRIAKEVKELFHRTEGARKKRDQAERAVIDTASKLFKPFPTSVTGMERKSRWAKKRFFKAIETWARTSYKLQAGAEK